MNTYTMLMSPEYYERTKDNKNMLLLLPVNKSTEEGDEIVITEVISSGPTYTEHRKAYYTVKSIISQEFARTLMGQPGTRYHLSLTFNHEDHVDINQRP